MGNLPVTLDFSKAQPIQPVQQTQDQTAPPASSQPVALDFSKAQPITSGVQPAMRAATPADRGADENGLPTVGSPVTDYLHDAESLTQEGRAEHPIKAQLGDIASKLSQYGDLIKDTVEKIGPALGGPVAGEDAAADLGSAASKVKSALGSAVDKAKSIVPSTERAGQTMNNLREAIGSHPVEMTEDLSKATSRAQELSDNGNTMSSAVRKFINRVTDPSKGHLTYDEARDYLTKFGSMTADEATKIAPAMKGQIQTIAGALKDSIAQTADRAGKLEDFQKSMAEYRNAKIVQNVLDWAKDLSVKGIAQKVGGTYALKELHDLISK
jgi:hypothetical protein